jgi:hypothetical protein
MQSQCEVCASFRPDLRSTSDSFEGVELQFFNRSVRLCALHAYLARAFKVTTLQGLRSLFRENRGKRSYVSRRVPISSAASVERRSMTAGRRARDLISAA